MDLSGYKELFLTETREHLSILNNAVLALEKNPTDSSQLEAIFRSVHTIKGMAATMGFNQVSAFCHQLENVLDDLRSHKVNVSTSFIDSLLNSLDILENLVELETGGESVEHLKAEVDKALQKMKEDFNGSDESDTQSAENKKYTITVYLEENCAMKSVRAFMVLRKFKEGELGTLVSSEPSEQELMNEQFDYYFKLVVESALDKADISNALKTILDVKKVAIKSFEQTSANVSEELIHEDSSIKRLEDKIREGVKDIRISIDRLDSLMAHVGELVILRGSFQQLNSKYRIPELEELNTNFVRLTSELQDEVMQARMVPIKHIFDRFPRLVRDVQRNLGKQVELVIQGGDIELDRSMLDQIGDPLVHLIRNSIDHGIEYPSERVAKGKPPSGTLRLVAERQKENVIVYVEDDGKGIDKDKVKQKAFEKGLITQEELNQLDDAGVYNLIAMPGFSTADRVTDVSGRGVGLDVVKMRVKALGGALEIASIPGEGTKCTLKLPVTLAIMQAMMVKVKNETYAIPISHTIEALEISNKALQTIKLKQAIILEHRDLILPFARLSEKLNVPDENYEKEKNNDKLSVVVVESGKKQVALLVDELIGQEDIVVKPLDPIFNQVKEVSGITITGGGKPAFILNVPSLMN